MLYLAKVQKIDAANGISLVALACQKSENFWSLVQPSEEEGLFHVPSRDGFPQEGFVLVEKPESGEVELVQDATSWVLMVIEQFLTKGITPEILMAEAEKAEEWRQALTLKSQDVVRRSLEVETRRDQIQELERGLEEKRVKLDAKADELNTLRQHLDAQQSELSEAQQHLEQEQQFLLSQKQEWQTKQESLQQELGQMEDRKRQLELELNEGQSILELKQ